MRVWARVFVVGVGLAFAPLLLGGCRDSCLPQDAEELYPGCVPAGMWRWDGAGCTKLVGCECVGRDCDRLYQSEVACLEAHDHCGAIERTGIRRTPTERGATPPEEVEPPEWTPPPSSQ